MSSYLCNDSVSRPTILLCRYFVGDLFFFMGKKAVYIPMTSL